MKVELGTLSLTIKVKDGEMQYGFPRLDILQDNLKEIIKQVPDGTYRWVLTMDLASGHKIDDTK